MRLPFVVASFSTVVLRTGLGQHPQSSPAHLLVPGDVQTPTSPQLGSGQWFGLYHNPPDGYELRATTVRIQDTQHGCGGQGHLIATSDSSRPLFLVSGVQSLRQGPVASVFQGSKFVYPAEAVPLKLGEDGGYRLSAFGTAIWRPSEVWVSNYELVLQRARARQVLAVFPRIDWDGPPHLLWAGDLDGDQQLDLVLDLRRSYVGHSYVLFLSGFAAHDSLVGRAAEFVTAGC